MPSPSTIGGGLMGSPATVDTGQFPPPIISNEGADYVGSSTITLLSTVLLCYAFELQTPIVILGGKWYMGATTTGTTNMGIYALAGNIVTGSDSGAITNTASGINSFTYATPVILAPGQYLMALACSNGTDTYFARFVAASNASHRGRRATNVLAAGALPLTTGVLTTTFNFPACSLTVQGGL